MQGFRPWVVITLIPAHLADLVEECQVPRGRSGFLQRQQMLLKCPKHASAPTLGEAAAESLIGKMARRIASVLSGTFWELGLTENLTAKGPTLGGGKPWLGQRVANLN
jgi:hypothetical protein